MSDIITSQLILADSYDYSQKIYKEGKHDFIDTISDDPPFNSDRDYNILFDPKTNTTEEAFQDTWSTIKYIDKLEDFKLYDSHFYEFLKTFMTIIPSEALKSYVTTIGLLYWFEHIFLKKTGSKFHHCDPHTSSYIKIVLDQLYGYSNWRNDIAWCYYGAGSPGIGQFLRKHDTILWYTKSKTYKWRPDSVRIPYSQYTKSIKGKKGAFGTAKNKDDIFSIHEGGKIPEDWWADIGQAYKSKKEYLKYPTQKPKRLVERMIKATTDVGDLVADFFNGGGTTAEVASENQRHFLCIDINHRSIQITKDRLSKLSLTPKKNYYIDGIPKSSKELRELVNQNIYGKLKNSKFELEKITIKYYLNGVVGNKKQVGDHSIDGRFSFVYQNKTLTGLVQITSSASINHLKAFCSEISKGTGYIGVYITFEDTLTKGMLLEAKEYGRIGNVDKIQILTFENLIDKGTQFEVPIEVKTT